MTTDLADPAETSTDRRWPLPIALGVPVLLALRLPLWLLPGPGRDEAAYHYWAHHPEPAYSPLVQAAVRACEFVGGHNLWTLRAPAILLGVLVLVLNDRRLARAGARTAWRSIVALVVAVTPWQSFVGSVLHPDDFFLAAALLLVLAAQRRSRWGVVGAAVAAVLAKPTGLTLLPVAWWLSGGMTPAGKWSLRAARAVLGLTALFMAMNIGPEMIAGMADFGRMSGVPWYTRGLAAACSLLFLGGPVVLWLAADGLPRRWRDRAEPEPRASLAVALVLLAVFLTAAVTRGQFKGNWVLPALVLLMPVRAPRWFSAPRARAGIAAGLALAAAASAGQTVVLSRPGILARVENRMIAGNILPGSLTYLTQAGRRESHVSSSRTWTDHVAEYGDQSAFVRKLMDDWHRSQGQAAPVRWIVAADYGLACQLHWYLGDPAVRVAIGGDGVFHRTWTTLQTTAPTAPMLALAVPVGSRLQTIAALPPIAHPVTGRMLQPLVVGWPNSNREISDVSVP